MGRFQEIYIKGQDPFERGRQHGEQTADRIVRICNGYKESFAKKGYTWEEALSMAHQFIPFLEQEMPDLMQEARGLAAGSQQPLDVIMVLNLRYELLKFKKESPEDIVKNGECTCFVALPEATRNHCTLSGQNWDKGAFVKEELYVLHIDEGNGNRIVGLSEPGQLIRNGMNTAGISLNASTLLSTEDRRGLCIPTNFIRRRVLQCHSFAEARKVIEGFRPKVSLNYVLASKEGEGIVYETNPLETYVIEPAQGLIGKGNDFVCNPAIDRFTPADPYHARHFRGQRMLELLKKRKGDITEEYLMDCLRDHYGYPGSICNHLKEKNLITIASMIYNLEKGYAWMSWGNPCENEYDKYIL
ncbi:C45 family autoproteolytic acyltransferase/hydolase [Acidaminococcus sp.]|uniref:C45 family autoproteolytic acyltransferase/hydolase n=1 Tax=Acidaminococcus sp. TaxID=1872103 RepID=UPI003D7EB964